MLVQRRPRRLLRVLNDPAQAGTPIGRIALDAGFGGISAFHQRFRQAFAMTPGEMRTAALDRRHVRHGSA